MKKLMIAVGLGLVSSSLWAACIGPFCWDDRGAYVAGVIQDGNGSGLISKTAAQIIASTPTVVGQELFCSDCVGGGGKGTVCVSTSTSGGEGAANTGYFVLSTGTICK